MVGPLRKKISFEARKKIEKGMTTDLEGGGVRTLVVGPLIKAFLMWLPFKLQIILKNMQQYWKLVVLILLVDL